MAKAMNQPEEARSPEAGKQQRRCASGPKSNCMWKSNRHMRDSNCEANKRIEKRQGQ